MASIPNNGYAAVMAGTNVYTGSNFYGSDCPKTPIVPTDPDDLCNKLYVDTIAGGGTVVSVTGGTNIVVTGTVPAPIVNLRNPLTAELNVGTQSLRDTAGAVGTSGQVLTAGTGGQVLWGANGLTGIGAGLNIGIDNTVPAVPVVRLLAPLTSALNVGSQDIISTTSAIDITPLAGQDCNVNVSGAGGLHTVQSSTGGSANPLARFVNTDTATGGVNVDLYKNRTGVTNDIVSALNFYGKDSAGTKTQFGGIESVITSAGGGGGVDGALDFYSCVNGGKSLVFRMNGADNENNSFRPLDMNGNNITTNTGTMTITTAASTGTGTLNLISKTGATAAITGGGSVQLIASAGSVSTTATTGIVSNTTAGGITLTAQSGVINLIQQSGSGIALQANGGGTIQAVTTGAATITANTQLSLTSNTGVFAITNELHYGKLSTPYTDQEFRSVYQPILTATTNTFPVAEIQREGQQVIFINSAGDGANELTPVITPNFTITAILRKVSIGQTIVGGFNHIQGRCEIRCGSGINDVVTDIPSGAFTYIAFPVNSTYYINVLYNSPLYPDTVAVGGFFAASAGTSYDDGTNNYPSDVLNFLCVDAITATIAPLNMVDSFGRYGVDSEVITISAQSQTYYTLATAPIFILGGKFNNLAGGVSLPANRTAVFCPNGTISPAPFVDRWNGFINADNTVNKIWVFDDRIVFAGLFSLIGGNTCPYLAFHDNTLTFPNTSLINGFTPPAGINSGFELSSTTCYVGCLVDTLPSPVEYPVYQFDLTNMGVTPSIPSNIPANTLIAPATGWLTETGATLDFIVGHDAGSNNYCYRVQTPDFVDLNGATYLQNCFLDTTAAPVPAFFHQASLASAVPTNYYLYVPSTGQVSITTTDALPFVSAIAPANNWKTITLGTRNNFATGTVVQFGTDDARIVILASNGASFSN